MDGTFEYRFPAIRGIQAGREFYVSQCPLRLLPRLFSFDDAELPVEVRAQRTLNRSRLPEIAAYLLENRKDYVLSAITASVDAPVRFEAAGEVADDGKIGVLHVPMTARFIINDGQHRRVAIEMALAEDPGPGDETIAVVFFLDVGLQRCQQMFADLNRYAVKPSASIGVLYDHRDPLSSITRAVVARVPLMSDLVEFEKTTLAPRSRKLFTLSALFNAHKCLLGDRSPGIDDLDIVEQFWRGTSRGFPEWTAVYERKMLAGEVRQDFIHSHGIVLHALGNVGACHLALEPSPDWESMGLALRGIDWSRRNPLWDGRAIIAGRVSKAGQNVILTTNAIKQHLHIALTPEEQRVEDAFTGGIDVEQ